MDATRTSRPLAWRRAAAGLAIALAVPATFAQSEPEPDPPITLTPIERLTEHGPIRGWAATVDLSDSSIDIVVSDIDGDADLDDADIELVEGAEVILTPMNDFVGRTGVHLAFNANFFAWKEDAEGNKTQADIIGLSVSDGVWISNARDNGFSNNDGDPAIFFFRRTVIPDRPIQQWAMIRPFEFGLQPWAADRLAEAEHTGPVDGVAGIGPSNTSSVPGTLLVKDGKNLGLTARVAPTKRHPRTAAGVSEDGTKLYVLVIDGRQIGHSMGATLPEMADLLIELGADNAVALDGGGSSSIIGRARFVDEDLRGQADPDGDGWITNRPSDGRYRPIANQVGIRWSQAGTYDAPPAYIPGSADVFSAGPLSAVDGVEKDSRGAGVGSEGSAALQDSSQESP